MTFHIVVVEMDEPITELPDCADMLDLYEAMQALHDAFLADARKRGTYGSWGAVRSLESAAYYVHGAMGYLAKDEGLIP